MGEGVVGIAAADVRMHTREPDLRHPFLVGVRGLLLQALVEEDRVKRVPLVVDRDGVTELAHVVGRECSDIESGHTHWSQPRVISSIGRP